MSWRPLIFSILLLAGGPAAAQPAGLAPALETALVSTADDGLTRQFYQQRNGALAWGGGATADARLAIRILSDAASEGLDPARYGVLAHSGNVAADDVVISTAVLQYMSDLAVGRPDLKSLDADVALPPRSVDLPAFPPSAS